MAIHIGGVLASLKIVEGQNTYGVLVPERYPGANKIYDDYYAKFNNVCNKSIPSEELFSTQAEIRFALLLSSDGILPDSVQRELSLLTIKAMDEAIGKKYALEKLKISKSSSGHQGVIGLKYIIYSKIYNLRKGGKSYEEAKNQVAEQHFLSPETIDSHYNEIRKKLKEL
ncbi:hypothetical protein [Glaciecola sp. 33A]|uniref:hypothetical protein n=1 Tax=Glaciecola sp. 33A TaxID=2057807 RepID=UPI000C345A98|nr:hypothetical protein [Glaciecola sp. 33A]PKI01910.1 hypothetical protein CXF81_09445 [Glaciecola sp. 33A]